MSVGKHVLVPIADGSEELEAVAIIDVLRRAGATVTVASVEETLEITASRRVRLIADAFINKCVEIDYDLIVLPGGIPGAEHLRDSAALTRILKRQKDAGRLYAAICASPAVVFAAHGLLDGRRATCHPGFAERMPQPSDRNSRVVVDGNLITSQGPGTAIEFALTLVEALFGKEKREQVAGPMVL
jgi:protein deglycase